MTSPQTGPRADRLESEFRTMQKLLASNPNRLFDVYCSTLAQEEAFSYLEGNAIRPSLRDFTGDTLDTFQTTHPGKFPEKYIIHYFCKMYIKGEDEEEPATSNIAFLQIVYGIAWPLERPEFYFWRPQEWGNRSIWHPNIRGSFICLEGNRPFPVGMMLVDVVPWIGRMLQYQDYNEDSALNNAAVRWATEPEHRDRVPVDIRDILDSRRTVTPSAGSVGLAGGSATRPEDILTLLPDM